MWKWRKVANRTAAMGVVVAMGASYYAASRPTAVAETTFEKAYARCGDLSAKEQELVGKIVRPCFPTNLDDCFAYHRLITSVDRLETKVQLSAIGGGMLGLYTGVAVTRNFDAFLTRVLARALILPPLISCGSAVAVGATVAVLVYGVREDALGVMVPVSPHGEALARKILPQEVVDGMVFKEPVRGTI